MLTDVLKSAPISYVKWDMNRNMTEIGSTAWPAKKQKEIAHRYMLGLYKILENITSNFLIYYSKVALVAVEDLMVECYTICHKLGQVMIQMQ